MPERSGRDTYMAVVLIILVGVPCFVFINILTMGLFMYLIEGAVAVAALGYVNYLLWGRSLTRETAWEREEMEMLGDDHPDV
ncbi:MAG TPA: hypothetical protein VKI17_12095 [Gemmataceae bacterium]|nr:hypothetical protein [Gemmataceae bacterium]